ncbi:MAG: hypothetical protein ACRYFS_00255 [Janthinobacterium lividum]
MSIIRVGRWMSRAEYDATVKAGRMQPTLDGRDMKHVTLPPDPYGFRAANPGSVFAEFDVNDAQMVSGGRRGWYIIYGPNSIHGRKAFQNGLIVTEMPAVQSIVITKIN